MEQISNFIVFVVKWATYATILTIKAVQFTWMVVTRKGGQAREQFPVVKDNLVRNIREARNEFQQRKTFMAEAKAKYADERATRKARVEASKKNAA